MASNIIHTEIDGHVLKLSNLDKILYPSIEVSKAEVIQYYLNNAELLLEHIKGRALTVIRYPDGIDGKSFYSKEKPEWTPDWIESVAIQHEGKKIEYLVPQKKADLVWLANMACIELHPMQYKVNQGAYPDFFVFDLDPDEEMEFDLVKETALKLRDFLVASHYKSFVKTSGGKGLHILIPLVPIHSFEFMVDAVKELTKQFVQSNPELYTLQIAKERRKGKILIDIYRNHKSNTTVAPYSLRGKPGAPLSMPIRWEHVSALTSAQDYTIKNYRQYLESYGDPWIDWESSRVELNKSGQQKPISENKLDPRLEDYSEKRKKVTSPEPLPLVYANYKDQYVVQLHDATNLHYDLRLEDEGVLLSWAIPKGLPFTKGQKRLAIRTEDHPIKYLDFEGVIPPGAYGAGQMWIFDRGKIHWIKKEVSSYHFTLTGTRGSSTYKLFRTKERDQWLLELLSQVEYYNVQKPILPMLAQSSKEIPISSSLGYEVKWDGIRVIIYMEDNQLKIISRNGNDLTAKFPELQDRSVFKVEQGIFDGEIVVLDDQGRPIFHQVISRMHTNGEHAIKELSRVKAVTCYLFDMMAIDGFDIQNQPCRKRREWLRAVFKKDAFYRFSETFEDGVSLLQAIEHRGMEGIMCKDQNSPYEANKRSQAWKKVKCRKLDQCLIIGYTAGKGDRSELFGALHLAREEDGQLIYMGKVGTGFDQKKQEELFNLLSQINKISKPIEGNIEEEDKTTWIEAELKCEVEYASMSSNQTYREPVFKGLM